MSYDRILEHACAGTLRPTIVSGLRFSLKQPGTLCIEVIDDRATNLTRYCRSVAGLDRVTLVRLVRRFDPIDDC